MMKPHQLRWSIETRQLKGGMPAVKVTVTTLGSEDLNAENSLDRPTHVAPASSNLAASGERLAVSLTPRSVTVYRIALK
jgi:alpha-L-arabinofuranosidase